jgi:GDP-D-mannose dehydratase
MRPEELKYLCGDADRTQEVLDWQPTYTFETMLDEMTEHWMKEID